MLGCLGSRMGVKGSAEGAANLSPALQRWVGGPSRSESRRDDTQVAELSRIWWSTASGVHKSCQSKEIALAAEVKQCAHVTSGAKALLHSYRLECAPEGVRHPISGNGSLCRAYGTRIIFEAFPALKRWAKIFVPQAELRHWRFRQSCPVEARSIQLSAPRAQSHLCFTHSPAYLYFAASPPRKTSPARSPMPPPANHRLVTRSHCSRCRKACRRSPAPRATLTATSHSQRRPTLTLRTWCARRTKA